VTRLPVELADEALAEATAAESWYRERSDRVAGRFAAEVERALTLLGERPALGPRWEHAGVDERVRQLPLRRFPFVLFYVVGASVVRVLAVAHTSREPGYWAGG
jgi:plasmid stabilization system protein ParE